MLACFVSLTAWAIPLLFFFFPLFFLSPFPWGRRADATLYFPPACARRNAVDFGLPLLNNARTALLFVESLAKKMEEGGLRGYAEGKIPSEVRSWREFVGRRA